MMHAGSVHVSTVAQNEHAVHMQWTLTCSESMHKVAAAIVKWQQMIMQVHMDSGCK